MLAYKAIGYLARLDYFPRDLVGINDGYVMFLQQPRHRRLAFQVFCCWSARLLMLFLDNVPVAMPPVRPTSFMLQRT